MRDRYPRLYRHVAARFTPGEQFGLHLTVGVALMLLGVYLFGSIADEVFEEDKLTAVDTFLANWFHQHKESAWTPFMMFVSDWHDVIGVSLMTIAFLWHLSVKKARYWIAAVMLSIPGGMVLNLLLKYTYQRARPSFDEPLVTLSTYSFPSGHTTGATLFYGVLAAYLVCVFLGWRMRALIAFGACFMIGLVALSRVYLGAHFLSDVMAAAVVGAAWVSICITAMSTLRRRNEARETQ